MFAFQKVSFAVLTLALAFMPARAADFEKYLLDDADGVLRINVKQILASDPVQKEYGAKLKDALAKVKEVQTVLTDLGLDPLNDIDRLVVVMGASCFQTEARADKGGAALDGGGNPFLICQGKFEPATFTATGEKMAKDPSPMVKIHEAGKNKFFEIMVPGLFGKGSLYLALLDQNTVVAGSKNQIVEAFDKAAGTKKTALKSKLMARLLDDMDRKSPVAFVAAGTMITGTSVRSSNENGVNKVQTTHHTLAEQGIEAVSGSTKLADKITAMVTLTTKDVDSAQKMMATMQTGLDETIKEAEKFTAQEKQFIPLIEAMKTIKINAKDNAISLQGEGSVNVIEAASMAIFFARAVQPVEARPAAIQNIKR
jgi:hypothetical protein